MRIVGRQHTSPRIEKVLMPKHIYADNESEVKLRRCYTFLALYQDEIVK